MSSDRVSRSRALVRRVSANLPVAGQLLMAIARPVVRRVVTEVSGRIAQRLSRRVIDRVARRWPFLADLLQAGEPFEGATTFRKEDRTVTDPVTTTEPMAGSRSNGGGRHAREAALSALRGSESWSERADAARALRDSDDPATVDALVHALRDPSSEVAVAAIESIATARAPRVRRVLVEALENQDGFFDSTTRIAAVRALGPALPEEQLGILFRAMRDVSAEVSLASIAALAERGGERTVRELTDVLADASGYFLATTRLAAARGLEKTGAMSPKRATVLLQQERDADVAAVLARVATR